MAGASGNVKAGKAFVEIMLDQTDFERGLKAAQKKLEGFGKSLTSLGSKVLGLATAAAAPFALSVRTFAAFDDEMRMVKGVTGSVDAEFKMLTETAEKLGRETSFTAVEVAQGMTAMGRMGFKAKEIDNAIPAVLNLARATGTELGEAAEIAANNMRVFSIEASEMESVADILTATANGSAQNLTDLAEGLKMAGPQASAAGDDIKNVSASLGVLANMGIKGSLAGTALRKAYSQFANTKIQAKLAEINIATTDQSGNLRAMPDIMADIARAMTSMPTARRLAFAEEIFDLRGALAGLQLGGNIQQLNSFISMLHSCEGTAAQTAEEMDRGIGGATRRFLSAVEGVQISIGRIIGDALAPFVDKVAVILTKLAEWAKAHQEVVISIAKVIGAVAAAGAAILALGILFKTVAFTVSVLNTAFTVMKVVVLAPIAAVKLLTGAYHALTMAIAITKTAAIACWAVLSSPAFLISAALAGVVALVWKLTGAWNMCADAIGGLWSEFSQAFSQIGVIFQQTWESIKLAFDSGDLAGAAKVAWAAVKVAWVTGIFPLKKAWIDLKGFLADSWTVTVYSLLKLGNNLWYGLLTGLKQIGDAMADAWDYIWNGIVNSFSSTCEWLEKQWVKFKGVFDSDAQVNAALQLVEQKYAAAREERDQSFAGNIQRREQERNSLSDEWTRSNAAIDQSMTDEIIANQQKYSGLIDQAQSDVVAAKTEWQSAMEEVKKRAAESAQVTAQAERKRQQATNGTRMAANRAGLSADSDKNRSSMGSWSLKELSGLLGHDYESRTAIASESSVRLQQETNRYLKKMSSSTLSYGG